MSSKMPAKRYQLGRVLGQLESEVMDILWQASLPVSVRYVTEVVKKKRPIAYTTVMTVMARLVAKGLLKRSVFDKSYLYRPVYSKDKFLARITRQIIKTVVSSFGEVAIAYFAKGLNQLPRDTRKKFLKQLKATIND